MAVLDYIGAGIAVLFAVLAFVGGTFMGAIISRAASQSGGAAAGAGLGAAIGAAIGVGLLISGGVSALIGWGMWSLKEWARILQIVFAGIGACLQALGILGSLVHFHILAIVWNLFWLGVNGFIIYYLIQPQVKAAFATKPAVSFAPPVPPAAGAGR